MTTNDFFCYNNSKLRIIETNQGSFSKVVLTARYAFYVTDDPAKFYLSRYPKRDEILPGFTFVDTQHDKCVYRAKRLHPLDAFIGGDSLIDDLPFRKLTSKIMDTSITFKYFDKHAVNYYRDMAEEISPQLVIPIVSALEFFNWIMNCFASENGEWRVDYNPYNFMMDRTGKIYWHDPVAVE